MTYKEVMKCVLCKGKKFTILFAHHKHWHMGKCLSCGLVQVAPMPSVSEIASLYHEDLDHFTPYIEQLSVHHAYFRQTLRQVGRNLSGKKILDIGCAMGVLLIEAKKRGMKAVGIDLSADAVGYCKKHGLTAHVGTLKSLAAKFPPNSLDIVSAFQVIEHEREPLDMVKRVYTSLKPGGVAVLATPNVGGFWSKLMGKKWVGFTHPEHVVLFDHKTMRRLMEEAGFHSIEVKNDTPRPFPLSFAFRRAADYFPWLSGVLRPIGLFLDVVKIDNPINPWDDMIVFARK
jgi:2-polyprenyl-3-methyl-5-hydroxy-6-metoxy-1,4-benzoquinol methylase